MINGKLSYFMISANLLEISDALQEKMAEIFDDYGMEIEFFNVESITVPQDDYEAVSRSKERRTGRLIEGYTWQEERKMMIAEKFATNEGTMGAVGGVMGGAMGGIVMGNTISEVAKNAISGDGVNGQTPPKDVSAFRSHDPLRERTFNVDEFLNTQTNNQDNDPASQMEEPTQEPVKMSGRFCAECGAPLAPNAKFCFECGAKVMNDTCPGCGGQIKPGMKFCPECGERLS